MTSSERVQRVFYLLTYLYWVAVSLPLALIVLIVQSRGLSLLHLSLLFGIHALTVFLLEVPTGALADLIGRKQVTVWAAVFMVVGFSLFLSAFSFPLLLLGGIVYGMSRALASGALDAWFIDEVQSLDPDVNIHPLLARAGVITLAGLATGTVLGGLLPIFVSFLPPEGTAILTPFSSTLLLSLLIQVLRLLLIVGLMVETPRRTADAGLRHVVANVPPLVRDVVRLGRENSVIRGLLFTSFAAGFVMFGLENLWQPHFATLLDGSEGNSVIFGGIMAGNFLLGAVGNMLSIPLGKWLGDRLALLAGLFELLRGTALLLLVMQVNWVMAALFFWVTYFGMGGAEASAATLFNTEVPATHRSSMLSIRSMVAYFGLFCGSLILGPLAERTSIEIAWGAGGLVLLLLLVPYSRIQHHLSARELGRMPAGARLSPREEEINVR